MARKILLLLLITLSLVSCISVSPNEQMAITKIANLWGGSCSISHLFSAGNNAHKSILVVSLKHSKALESKMVTQQFVASSMALTTYKQLNENERTKYDCIRCQIDKDVDAGLVTSVSSYFDYSITQLKMAVSYEPYFHYCSNQIKSKQIQTLFEHFDTTITSKDKIKSGIYVFDTLISGIINRNGRIDHDSILTFGFNKYAAKNGDSLNFLGYYGFLLNDNEKPLANMFVIINPVKNIDAQFLVQLNLNPMN